MGNFGEEKNERRDERIKINDGKKTQSSLVL
jgi:hypothetical protein